MRGVVFSEPAVNAPERPPVAGRRKGVTHANCQQLVALICFVKSEYLWF